MSDFENTKTKGETRRLNAIVAYETWMLIRSYANKSNMSIGEVIAEAISFWQLQEQQLSASSILEMNKLLGVFHQKDSSARDDQDARQSCDVSQRNPQAGHLLPCSICVSNELETHVHDDQYKDPTLFEMRESERHERTRLEAVEQRLIAFERAIAGFEDLRALITEAPLSLVPRNLVTDTSIERSDGSKNATRKTNSTRQKRRGRKIDLDA